LPFGHFATNRPATPLVSPKNAGMDRSSILRMTKTSDEDLMAAGKRTSKKAKAFAFESSQSQGSKDLGLLE
jgi:hypothetical protein